MRRHKHKYDIPVSLAAREVSSDWADNIAFVYPGSPFERKWIYCTEPFCTSRCEYFVLTEEERDG